MNSQYIVNNTFLESDREDSIDDHRFYKKIVDNYSLSQKYEFKDTMNTASKVNTASKEIDIKDLFPNNFPILRENSLLSSVSRENCSSSYILQEWEGYVLFISGKTFTARLIDVTKNSSMENEEADFLINDVEESDRNKISIGSIFRWTIYYRRSPSGTRERSSRIVFRNNLPAWSKKELKKNREVAIAWANDLNKK